MTRALLASLAVCFALIIAAVSSGCGAPLKCGPGTKLQGTTCVAISTGSDAGPVSSDAGPSDGGPTDGGETDACVRVCAGRDCGDDGCGGSCGTCSTLAAPACNTVLGVCQATCTPACAGRTCGDDGCGGTCGACSEGGACNGAGVCVPDAWTCQANQYGAHDLCQCNCGAPDPDCGRDAGLPVVGCQARETCNSSGACVSEVPSAWTCPPEKYDSHAYCDCGCGAHDPDCDNSDLAVLGCVGDHPTCNADGTCAACTADCTGKVCGSDGCGGTCGSCATDATDNICVQGQCVGECDPSPVRCRFNSCGDDGCGGSCGSCADNQTCTDGNCVTNSTMHELDSCVGHCASVALSGCLCTAACAASDAGLNCCSDYAAACSCTPNCDGKTCGDDGCGGSCGTCASGSSCSSGQCITGCQPQCDGLACGDDGCGGSCGSCGAGSSCIGTGQCLPDSWICDPLSFAAGDGICDCGCGGADPDCASSPLFTLGCPSLQTACTSSGVCSVTFCSANSGCSGGQWCTDVYYKGGGHFAGTCGNPVTTAGHEGQPCSIDEDCEAGVCLGGLCRLYCAADADCGSGETCDAQPVLSQGLSPRVAGFAGVCDLLPGAGSTCASQAACGGDTCVAVMNPTTLAPRYLCAATSANIGTSCSGQACPAGQLCSGGGHGSICTLPCPGGNADCLSGYHCGSIPFNSAMLVPASSAAEVPVCLPQ
jgi:hypothetical protein